MIRFENTEIMGWQAAIREMRNILNSLHESDSGYCHDLAELNREGCDICPIKDSDQSTCHYRNPYIIGPNDHDLMMRLVKEGLESAKYRQMIVVYVDITAPLYFWQGLKEADYYSVVTVKNSYSTMHKIAAKEFTLEDFSCEHLWPRNVERLKQIIEDLNDLRDIYLHPEKHNFGRELETKDIWWQMIQLLPNSYNQKRTIMLNFEVLSNIYGQRKNHKLDEWNEFCHWIETLPYSELITQEEALVAEK